MADLDYFFSDVYDVPGHMLTDIKKRELDNDDIVTNLAVRWVWEQLYGVYPSKADAAEVRSKLPSNTGFQNTDAIIDAVCAHIHKISGIPVSVAAEHKSSLASMLCAKRETWLQKDVLCTEVIRKLWDRYVCGTAAIDWNEFRPDTKACLPWLQRKHADIVLNHSTLAKLLKNRCASVSELYELAKDTIKRHSFGITNLLSGAVNLASADDVRLWLPWLCIEDAMRMSVTRDRQLCMQLIQATLIVETSADVYDHELLVQADAASQRAVVLVSARQLPPQAFHVNAMRIPKVFPYLVHFIPKLAERFVWVTPSLTEHMLAPRAVHRPNNILRLLNPVPMDVNVSWNELDGYDRLISNHSSDMLHKITPTRTSVYYISGYSVSEEDETDVYLNGIRQHLSSALWKAHLTMICPIRNTNTAKPSDGMLLFLRFVQSYLVKHRSRLHVRLGQPLLRESDIPEKTIIVIDNRASILTMLSAVISMVNCESHGWKLTVVCTQDAHEFYTKTLPQKWREHTRFIIIDDYPTKKFSVQTYSTLLKSAEFWQQIPEEHSLVVQDDGVIVKPGVEQYLQYDYVGAPWARDPSNAMLEHLANPKFVGNGGVSLRSTRIMQSVCDGHAASAKELFGPFPQELPEDVFFSRYVHLDGYRVCPESLAGSFASEQVLNTSLGFHKPWAYHHPRNIQSYFDEILKA